MKRILMIMLLMMGLPAVMAEEDAGTTPDSPLYGIDKIWDRLRLALTFDKAKRSEKALQIAEERLAELLQMMEEGKLEDAADAQEAHDDMIEEAEESCDEIDEDDAEEELEKISRIQNRIENHVERVGEVKDSIVEWQKVNMTEEQKAQLEEILERIKERSQEMEEIAEQNKEQAKKKLNWSGKSPEEIDEIEAEIDNRTGLKEGRKDRAEKSIRNAEEALKRALERLREQQSQGINITGLDEMIEELEEQLKQWQNMTDSDVKKAADEIKETGNDISEIAVQIREAREQGNADEVKEQLEEAIRERHEERMREVEEQVPEEAREAIRKAIENREREEQQDEDSDETPAASEPVVVDVYLNPEGAHTVGGISCGRATPAGSVADCGGGTCFGNQNLCVLKRESPLAVIDAYFTSEGQHVEGGPGCEEGYMARGTVADCGVGPCGGNQQLCVKTELNPSEAVTDIYLTSEGQHVVGGPGCEDGYVSRYSVADCGGGECHGNQELCVRKEEVAGTDETESSEETSTTGPPSSGHLRKP